jgi:hypothetical protein
MVEEGRRLGCRHCGREVWICRRCDRGHRYCSPLCRQKARRQSSRQARRRYQATSAGRSGNARRQREWYRRKRSSQKIAKHLTHQGSPGPALDAIIPPATDDACVAVMESAGSVESDAVESPASEAVIGPVELLNGARRCTVCRRLFEIQSLREPRSHGCEETSSET